MISDVGRLRSLREIAQRGTVTAAAASLGYTPSAVSQQISSLEAELGVPVLQKRGRNVVLTDAGRLLVEHSADILGSLERAESAVAELHGEPIGPVRIGALASAAATILPVALRGAIEDHPGLEPEMVVYPLDQNLAELRHGTLDIAVDQSFDFEVQGLFETLDRTVLLEEPLLLISPVDDPCDSVVDAADRAWAAAPVTSACGRSARDIAAGAGISPRFSFETDDAHALVRMAAAGLVVGIVPSLCLQDRPTDVHVAVIPDASRTLSAVTRPAAGARPAVTAIVEHLVRAAPQFEYDAVA